MKKITKKKTKKAVKKVKKRVKKTYSKRKREFTRRGRPKKTVKYTKTINVRLTQEQWVNVLNWAQKAHLEPSVYIRKVLLDFLNISEQIPSQDTRK